MKMLFFSADRQEVELVRTELVQANIPCEVVIHGTSQAGPAKTAEAELWIQTDEDWHRAAMLCVELGIGFAKPAPAPEQVAA